MRRQLGLLIGVLGAMVIAVPPGVTGATAQGTPTVGKGSSRAIGPPQGMQAEQTRKVRKTATPRTPPPARSMQNLTPYDPARAGNGGGGGGNGGGGGGGY